MGGGRVFFCSCWFCFLCFFFFFFFFTCDFEFGDFVNGSFFNVSERLEKERKKEEEKEKEREQEREKNE